MEQKRSFKINTVSMGPRLREHHLLIGLVTLSLSLRKELFYVKV